ncbi:MAG: glycosyltransferase family 2 protein [Winogradskyella sp.]|nr:glycosyltransferase family 2 protein [Winogradskyella sp.]
MQPFISVIIPLYNKAPYISETVSSVLSQSLENYELIIIDDGSTDDSVEKVKQFNDDRIKIYQQNNKGVAAARNKGVDLAKAEYIAFLDADDYWDSTHLETLKTSITKFPDAGLFCNNYKINYNGTFATASKINVNTIKPILIEDYFKASKYDSLAWTSAVAIPKLVFLNIGGFNSDLKTGEDLDLWIRLALNYKVVFNPKSTMIYNKHVENSLSKNNLVESRLHFFELHKQNESHNSSLKTYLDKKRYEMALRAKLRDDDKTFTRLKQDIYITNLNTMQKLALNTPRMILQLLYNIKQMGKK